MTQKSAVFREIPCAPHQGQPLPDRRGCEPGRLGVGRGHVEGGRRRGHGPRQLLPGFGRQPEAPRRRCAAEARARRRHAAAAADRGRQGHGRRAASGRADVDHHGSRPLDGSRRQHPRAPERDRGLLPDGREEAGVHLLQRRVRLWPRPEGRSRGDHALPHLRRRRQERSSTAPARSSASSSAATPSSSAGSTTWWCAIPPSTASASTTGPPTPSTSSRRTTGCARTCRPRVIGDGSDTKHFVHVSDAARANAAAFAADATNVAVNISGPKPTTTLEIVRLVTELAGKNLAPEHVEPEAGKVQPDIGRRLEDGSHHGRAHHRLEAPGRHARRHPAAAGVAGVGGEIREVGWVERPR